MSRFKRQRQRTVPALNVASLPDLIFTVLFFFMIVTHMRDVDPKVQYNVPEGTELTKEVNKSGLVYLFIGKPVDAQGRVIADLLDGIDTWQFEDAAEVPFYLHSVFQFHHNSLILFSIVIVRY